MSPATQRRDALTHELAVRVLSRETGIRRVVSESPAAFASLQVELAARVARAHKRFGAFSREVLVVEDNDDIREITVASLSEALRVPVRSAANAADARAKWAKYRPGMVVVDLHLPDMLGDELILSFDRGVHAVLVSGVTDRMTLEMAARRCNAIAIQKPPDGLLEIVRRELDAVCPPLWCRANADHIVAISPDLARLIGRSPETLAGTSWQALVHPDDLARSESTRAYRMSTGADGFVQRMRRADGGYVTLRWDVAPMVDGVVYAIARVV